MQPLQKKGTTSINLIPMKTITALFSLLLFSITILAQKESLILNYDSDKSELTTNHNAQLNFFLKKIPLNKIQNLKITGHTDTISNITYNQILSKKRATNVENYFLSRGIPANLIQISWLGETQAISPSNLIEDRKVVIEVFFPIEKKNTINEIITTPIPKPEPITPVSELFQKLELQPQEFCISSKKDTLLRCANGTIINIKENSFQLNYAQQQSKSCIRFQVKEVFSYSDMILENLTTTADGSILETQGMIYTMEALLDTLPKVNLENLEVAYRNKTISFEDYKFYVFNTSNFGWKNVDIFPNIPDKDRTTFKINLSPSPEVDCKLVIQERSFVLPAQLAKDHFYFEGIPKNETAWVVAIKYEKGQPLLALKKIVVKKENFDLDFEALTLEELKEKLKALDFLEEEE